jgi:uncharacterized protein YdcH (DUF465 family)
MENEDVFTTLKNDFDRLIEKHNVLEERIIKLRKVLENQHLRLHGKCEVCDVLKEDDRLANQ